MTESEDNVIAYTPWSVSFGEQPSTAKWNLLGSNDASFNDGTGFQNGVLSSELLKSTIAAKAYRSTAFNFTSSETILVFDTEVYDAGGDYDTGTGKFTCPLAGYYFVTAQSGCNNPGDQAQINISIFQNSTAMTFSKTSVSGASGDPFINSSILLKCAASDTIEARIQGSGTFAGSASERTDYLTVHFVGVG